MTAQKTVPLATRVKIEDQERFKAMAKDHAGTEAELFSMLLEQAEAKSLNETNTLNDSLAEIKKAMNQTWSMILGLHSKGEISLDNSRREHSIELERVSNQLAETKSSQARLIDENAKLQAKIKEAASLESAVKLLETELTRKNSELTAKDKKLTDVTTKQEEAEKTIKELALAVQNLSGFEAENKRQMKSLKEHQNQSASGRISTTNRRVGMKKLD